MTSNKMVKIVWEVKERCSIFLLPLLNYNFNGLKHMGMTKCKVFIEKYFFVILYNFLLLYTFDDTKIIQFQVTGIYIYHC